MLITDDGEGIARAHPSARPLVLVADDDGVTRAMLGSWLTGSGYEVVAARDGNEALRLAGEREPDLILVDLIMPGLDGYEVCRTIQADGESPPPVIFITARDWTGDRVTGLEAGAVDYIAKPFERDELIARVHAALNLSEVTDEHANGGDPAPLVLIADDDRVTCARVGSWLAASGYAVVIARDGGEALRIAGERGPDLLLVDLVMPVLDGYGVCREIQARSAAPPPVIFITGNDRAGRRVDAFDAGAVDYILKPFDQEELMARVRAALRSKSVRDELAAEAAHDALTGLLNRRALDARALEAVALAQRHERPLSCILLDIDHFKGVNDVHGHAAGDLLLRETGRRLAAACRVSDIVARYGGEEFALLLPETPAEAAVILADKLRSALSEIPFAAGDALIPIRASAGVAAFTPAMATPSGLLAAADEALYLAKDLGRDRTELYAGAAALA